MVLPVSPLHWCDLYSTVAFASPTCGSSSSPPLDLEQRQARAVAAGVAAIPRRGRARTTAHLVAADIADKSRVLSLPTGLFAGLHGWQTGSDWAQLITNLVVTR